MIFYTIQGPKYRLEIHENTIKLVPKKWFNIGESKAPEQSWEIQQLSLFEMTRSKFMIFTGQLKWETFEGSQGIFNFNTSPVMVKKIETYLQKRIIKNHQNAKKSA